MKKETPTEKYLREILALLKTKANEAVTLSASCQHVWIRSCCNGVTSGHTGPCYYNCANCGIQKFISSFGSSNI